MTADKKLLIVLNVDWYFLLHWFGRAERALLEGYEVHLAVGITNQENLETLQKKGIKVHPIPLHRKGISLVGEAATLFAIRRVIKKIKPGLVHTGTIKPNLYGGFWCRIYGLPIVGNITGLGTIFTRNGGFFKLLQRLFIAFYWGFFNKCNAVLFLENHDDLHLLADHATFNAGSLKLIPGAGVDTQCFSISPEPTSKFKVLFAGRLYRNKGIEDLVDAIDILKKENLCVELVVAGMLDGQASGAISEVQIERWDKEESIVWLGKVDDVTGLISTVHVVCQPSRTREGLPRIILEAMSCGRAVVATDVPGCREAVVHEKNGLLVPPGDVRSLANAIARLVKSPELRHRFSLEGRKIVEKKYASSLVLDQTIAAYKAVS